MRPIVSSLVLILCMGCNATRKEKALQKAPIIQVDSFAIPNTTIRALHVVSDSQVWFAGSNGKWGFTHDAGRTWHIDSVDINGIKPHFRSIALTKSDEGFLVSIEKPAAVFKASLLNPKWEMVYQDTSEGAFFDMIKLGSNSNGIVLGDPKNGCFHVARTGDEGRTWQKVACQNLPTALENEAPFAASNSNMDYIGKYIWFATGGPSGSRVYRSVDDGKVWHVSETPIVKGGKMTGTYSIDFFNKNEGIIAGGNWDSITQITPNIALTHDGGQSWTLKDTRLPYISCVQFIPNKKAKKVFLLSGRGRPGDSRMFYYDLNADTLFSYPNTNFLGVQFASDSIAWLCGKNKIGRMKIKVH